MATRSASGPSPTESKTDTTTTGLTARLLEIGGSTAAAMAIARDKESEGRLAFWATGLLLFTFWNLGTFIGALATNALPDPKVLGLDAAPPAAFLALLAPRLRAREPMAIALAAGVVALICLPFVPAGIPLLIVAVLVALYGVLRTRP